MKNRTVLPRILLLACIALALARPQIFYQGLSLRGDLPLAVVMIFEFAS